MGSQFVRSSVISIEPPRFYLLCIAGISPSLAAPRLVLPDIGDSRYTSFSSRPSAVNPMELLLMTHICQILDHCLR
jgi:hypothetical protein